MTRIRPLVRCFFFAIFLLVPVILVAQSPLTPASGPTAHVRFWKTELRAFPNLRVTLKPSGGRHPATRGLGGGKPGYLFDDYADVPAGHSLLEVFLGTEVRPVVSLEADLAPGAFMTVLLSEPEKMGNSPHLEMIDDGNLAADATRSQITVRNLIAGLQDMHLTVGDILNVQFVSGDSFLQMRGLKSAVYPLRTVGTGVDGKPFDWNIDVDFRQNRHQTLLIYPDPYGRIRPRLIVDGGSRVDPPQPANPDVQR